MDIEVYAHATRKQTPFGIHYGRNAQTVFNNTFNTNPTLPPEWDEKFRSEILTNF